MKTDTQTKSLRLTIEEWAAVNKAAEAAHLTSHAWIRIVVNAALGSALPEHLERIRPGRNHWPAPPDCETIDIPTCPHCSALMENDESSDGEITRFWRCRCGHELLTSKPERRTK